MANLPDFASSAKGLAKSPLGIIALFLVLVYAVASLVISIAQPAFFEHARHPIVIFLATFPVIVLFVFAHLVANHHGKLYAPHEYKNQDHFFRTLRVPEEVSRAAAEPLSSAAAGGAVATSDQVRTPVTAAIQPVIDQAYRGVVDAGLCLIHEAEVLHPRTSPKSGRYRIRVWVESFSNEVALKEIDRVTYRVWDDFVPTTLATTDLSSNFDLWLNVYGEFPILAIAEFRGGTKVQLHRYLDLPGRPPD
jgi:hypothetical protein